MSVSDKKYKASSIAKVSNGMKEMKEMKKALKNYKLQVENLESENKSLNRVLSERRYKLKNIKNQMSPDEKTRCRIDSQQAKPPILRFDSAKKNHILVEDNLEPMELVKKRKLSFSCKNLATQATYEESIKFLIPKKVKLPKKASSKINRVPRFKAFSKQSTSSCSKNGKSNEKMDSNDFSAMVNDRIDQQSTVLDKLGLSSHEIAKKHSKKNRDACGGFSANNERVYEKRHREEFIENLRENVELFTELVQDRPEDLVVSQEWFVEIISKYLKKYTERVFRSFK